MTYRAQGPSPIAAWLLIAINLVLYLVRVVNPEIILDLGNSGAIYFNPTIDLTEEVIRRYNASKATKK